jgi:hypothetical protein
MPWCVETLRPWVCSPTMRQPPWHQHPEQSSLNTHWARHLYPWSEAGNFSEANKPAAESLPANLKLRNPWHLSGPSNLPSMAANSHTLTSESRAFTLPEWLQQIKELHVGIHYQSPEQATLKNSLKLTPVGRLGGWRSTEIIEFHQFICSFRPHLTPWVYSASNRNEYRR